MEFIRNEMDWQLKSGGHTILDCKIGKPAIYVDTGRVRGHVQRQL